MGKMVNVVLWDGRIVSMPEDEAAQVEGTGNASQETQEGEVARAQAAQQTEENTGAARTIQSGIEGALDTLSLGGYGKLVGAIDPEQGERMAERGQEHGTARAIGEYAAMLLPGVGEVGLGGKLARGAEELVGGSKLIGRAVEGAAYGAGGEVAHTNVSGDPLTVEATVESAGLGALFNAGAGGLADKFRGAASRAQAAQVAEQLAAKESKFAANAGKLFEDPPASWDDFRESWKARQKSVGEFNAQVGKEAEAYHKYWSTSKLSDAVDRTQSVVNDMQNARRASAAANRFGGYQTIDGTLRNTQIAYDASGEARQVVSGAVTPSATEAQLEEMKDYQRRISRVRKLMTGGYEIDNSGKWVPNSSIQPDRQRALEELRSIQADLKGKYSNAIIDLGKYGDLPDMPRDPMPQTDIKLPSDLRDFARKRPETIAELAQHLDPTTADALKQLTEDLGFAPHPSGDPAATLAGLHQSLGDYTRILDRIEADTAAKKAAEDAAKQQSPVMYAMKYAGRRMLGAAAGGIVGGPMGFAAGAVAGDMMGAVMMGAKDSLRTGIRDLVAKYGVGAANATAKLGPVTAWLAHRWPDGARDKETDQRRLAVNRVNEFTAAAPVSPDAAYQAIQPFLGMANDVAFKIHQQIVGAIAHMTMASPKDPGLDTTLHGSNWTPSYHDTVALAYRLEALHSPLSAIARAMSGDLNPAAADTLWAVWPAVMSELANEVATQSPAMKQNYRRASGLSLLLRQPVTALQHPQIIATIQGIDMQSQQPTGQMASTGGKAPQPTGRPPAVQSSVAGSDPSGLISQA